MNNRFKTYASTWTNRLCFLFIASILLSLTSCSDEVAKNDDERTYFLKKYGNQNAEFCGYIGQTADKGFVIASSQNDGKDDARSMFLTRTNAFGSVEWQKEIKFNEQTFPRGTTLNNGNHLISSWTSGNIAIVNDAGDVLVDNNFRPDITGTKFAFFSSVIDGDDGLYYVGSTNGQGTGGAGDNRIQGFDQNGNTTFSVAISDSRMGGKVLFISAVRIENGEITFAGNIYPNPWQWGDPAKAFVAKIKLNTADLNVTIFDLQENHEHDYLNASIPTNDNGVALLVAEGHVGFSQIGTEGTGFEVIKSNANADLEWKTEVTVGIGGVTPMSIRETEDGSLIVTGSCLTTGTSNENSFVVRLTKTGEVAFSKVFDIPGSNLFTDGNQQTDGSYFFTGMTTAFGNGKEFHDPFILRADAQGNYNP
ncbi:MAG: hypothetical protein ACI8ZN_001545 [Bacteroidia bacterium]|jgi:hypothetical protein